MTYDELLHAHCQPRQGGKDGLDATHVQTLLELLPGWDASDDGTAIVKDFVFKNFHHTLGFINAVGFIANREDHHPDLEAGYGHCKLVFSTHDVGGLSLNDFICAAKVEALLH